MRIFAINQRRVKAGKCAKIALQKIGPSSSIVFCFPQNDTLPELYGQNSQRSKYSNAVSKSESRLTFNVEALDFGLQ